MMARTAWSVQKSVVMALTLRELKTRFGATRLGYVWVLFEPALHIMMLVVVFAFIKQRVQPGLEFPVWLVAGLIPYLLFRNIALRTMGSVQANRALFSYRQIKPMDAMISRVLFEAGLTIFVYAATLVFMAVLGFHVVPAFPLELLGLHILVIIFGFGCGVLFSILVHLMPESALAIRVMFMPLYFMSGVIFPLSMVPRELLPWLMWNPVLHFVELARAAFFRNYILAPDISLTYVLIVPAVFLYIGFQFYYLRRLRLAQR